VSTDMINNILIIKHCGIFQDFEWKTIPDFKRFNLIYGWNRSGKTTLSRIIHSACSKVFPFDDPDARFELNADIGTVKSEDFSFALSSVRVFNSDFVRNNIRFDTLHAEPIVYVSEEDIKLKNDLEALVKEKVALEIKLGENKTLYEDAEREEESFRTDVALVIKSVTGVHRDGDRYANYDRRGVMQKIEEAKGVENLETLSNENLEKFIKIASGDPKKKISKVSCIIGCAISIDSDGVSLTQSLRSFVSIKEDILNVLAKKVETQVMERLVADPILRDWVEHGLELHKTKHDSGHCLFCEQALPVGFLDGLSSYFSSEYRGFKKELLAIKEALKNIKISISPILQSDFYEDMNDSVASVLEEIEIAIVEISRYIQGLAVNLEEKLKDTSIVISPIVWRDDLENNLNSAIDKLNDLINQQNTKVDNASGEKVQAKSKIEEHYIAQFDSQKNYKVICQNVVTTEQELKKTIAIFEEKKVAVVELQKKTSSIGKAIDRINAYLREFFGSLEIVLQIADDKKGYQIIRDGELASNLCEGEKTAIAFAHFMTKLGEDGFDLKSGIVVIDDPVSSFDSMRIHHCFAVLKREIKDCEQVFILTHSFEFFDLIKQWFKKRDGKRYRDKKDSDCGYYMIKTNIDAAGNRIASIAELDEALKKYDSEYQYLFAELNRFVAGDPAQRDMYIIGNMARRFLEAYLRFKLPSEGDVSSKLESLEIPEHIVSPHQKTQIYHLVNQRSHAEPFQVSYHQDLEECKAAVAALLKIIEHSDKKHFDALIPR